MDRKFSSKRPLTDAEEAEIQAMIASDPDNPEITDEQIGQAKSFAEAFPELSQSINRSRGRPPMDNPKKAISIRLDQTVIDKFKATGPGWQSRMNDVLKRADV